MAFALIQEWKGATPGTDLYDAVSAKLDVENSPPDGLIAHTAGRDSNGVWRIFGVWESREQAERFEHERVMPAVLDVTTQQGADLAQPDTMDVYELHAFIHP